MIFAPRSIKFPPQKRFSRILLKFREFKSRTSSICLKTHDRMFALQMRLLHRAGLEPQKMFERFGVKRSFKIAKAASIVDIMTEALGLAIGATAVLSMFVLIGLLAYYNARDVQHLGFGGIMNFSRKLASSTITSKEYLLIALSAGLVSAFDHASTSLDLFQQTLVSHLSDLKLEENARLKLKQYCNAFILESSKEIIAGLTIDQIPWVLLLQKLWAIRSEFRQLAIIKEMEKLVLSSGEGK